MVGGYQPNTIDNSRVEKSAGTIKYSSDIRVVLPYRYVMLAYIYTCNRQQGRGNVYCRYDYLIHCHGEANEIDTCLIG